MNAPMPKKTKYTPPSTWERASLGEVLLRTGRRGLDRPAEQLTLGASEESDPTSPILRLAGDMTLLGRTCVAIVGTRRVSAQGRARARRLARELVARDIVVVSGLATGVDHAAHTAAIEAGGRTVSVIGTPLEQAYPAAHAELQEEIWREHLLVSQFEEGMRVFPSNFPRRNRVMAALSDATVIIEAGETSGTLHQAKEAVRLGRWLFIAQSLLDAGLKWPASFLKEPRAAVLKDMDDILSRLRAG